MANLRESLTRIYEERGQLTPQLVVDDARPVDSELHSRFEWDDAIAGEEYRLVQARNLIRSVEIVYTPADDPEPRRVRAYSTVRGQDPDHMGYKKTEDLLQDDFSRKLLLKQCQRDIAALQKRYGHLSEFAQMLREAIA